MWLLNFVQWSVDVCGSSSMKLSLISLFWFLQLWGASQISGKFLQTCHKAQKFHSHRVMEWISTWFKMLFHLSLLSHCNCKFWHSAGCNTDTLLHSDMQDSVLSLSLLHSWNKFDKYRVIQKLILENYGVRKWNKIFPSQHWSEEPYGFKITARCIHMKCVTQSLEYTD
jgi:hypothetical protein